jgi:hypothetical protein
LFQKTYNQRMTRLMPFGLFLVVCLMFVLPVAVRAQAQEAAAEATLQMVADEASADKRAQVGLGVPAPQPRLASEEGTAADNENFDDMHGMPQETDADVTVMEDPFAGEYIKGTPENLSKLYWRLRVFDLDDDRAVDNFMMINECDLYQRYIHDDFEWAKIREAARSVLHKERDKYSGQFEFILPVRLGRYDTDHNGFYLIDDTEFKSVRRIEIVGNSLSTEICGTTGEIKDYPRNLLLILKKPFSYNFAKVDEHVAQAYIIRKQKEVLGLDYDYRKSRYNRVAYVRMRVNLDQYQGNVKGQDGVILSILQGDLEGVDLFEDPYGRMLLSTLDYADGKPASGDMNVSTETDTGEEPSIAVPAAQEGPAVETVNEPVAGQ